MNAAEQYIFPSTERARRLDAALRTRLGSSIDYLAGVIGPTPDGPQHWSGLRSALAAGPVSPWTFGLYANLVADLSHGADVSRYPADLARAAAMSAASDPVACGDPVVPETWWDGAGRLLDTDKASPFRVAAPPSATSALCAREVAAGLALLAELDRPFFDDVMATLRVIVLAVPGAGIDEPFDGASTFFLWGMSVINAANRRGPVAIVDLLVHESGHLLLFGLAGGSPLLVNQAGQRIASPLRTDLRPIEGVFHAAFVATRVHCAMTRLIAAGPDAVFVEAAETHRDRNGGAGRAGLATLLSEANPTERGADILEGLRHYWAGA